MSLTEIKCDCITDRKPKYTGGKPIVTAITVTKNYYLIFVLINMFMVIVGAIVGASWFFWGSIDSVGVEHHRFHCIWKVF